MLGTGVARFISQGFSDEWMAHLSRLCPKGVALVWYGSPLEMASFLHCWAVIALGIMKLETQNSEVTSSMENFVQSFYTWYKQTMRHPKYRWFLIGGTLLYLVSPIDIAPDFIPLIGWVDDVAIAGLLVAEVSQVMLELLTKRKGTIKTENDQPADLNVMTIDVE